MHSCWLVLLLLSTGAQAEPIQLGSVELRLGMSKSEAKAKIVSAYPEYAKFPEEFWDSVPVIVVDRLGGPGDTKTVGYVTFTNGRLVRVDKTWTPTDQSAESFVRNLLTLVSAINEAGETIASVTAQHRGTPEATFDNVVISFVAKQQARRTVYLTIERGTFRTDTSTVPIRGTTIAEVFEYRPTTKK